MIYLSGKTVKESEVHGALRSRYESHYCLLLNNLFGDFFFKHY